MRLRGRRRWVLIAGLLVPALLGVALIASTGRADHRGDAPPTRSADDASSAAVAVPAGVALADAGGAVGPARAAAAEAAASSAPLTDASARPAGAAGDDSQATATEPPAGGGGSGGAASSSSGPATAGLAGRSGPGGGGGTAPAEGGQGGRAMAGAQAGGSTVGASGSPSAGAVAGGRGAGSTTVTTGPPGATSSAGDSTHPARPAAAPGIAADHGSDVGSVVASPRPVPAGPGSASADGAPTPAAGPMAAGDAGPPGLAGSPPVAGARPPAMAIDAPSMRPSGPGPSGAIPEAPAVQTPALPPTERGGSGDRRPAGAPAPETFDASPGTSGPTAPVSGSESPGFLPPGRVVPSPWASSPEPATDSSGPAGLSAPLWPERPGSTPMADHDGPLSGPYAPRPAGPVAQPPRGDWPLPLGPGFDGAWPPVEGDEGWPDEDPLPPGLAGPLDDPLSGRPNPGEGPPALAPAAEMATGAEVPEPATAWLFGAALLAALAIARRRPLAR